MSLQTFFSKLDGDIAKVAPIVDTAVTLGLAIFPSEASVVSAVEVAVKAAAAAGLSLENDVESLWSAIKPAVASITTATKAAAPAPTPAPSAGA